MNAAQRREQLISRVYGNIHMEHPHVTREMVAKAVDDLVGAATPTTPPAPLDGFSYAAVPPVTPATYVCQCGATGMRLYREPNDCRTLFCRLCAMINQERLILDDPREHEIGWLLAAVPREDDPTLYWGYTNVPDAGVAWWERLPKTTPLHMVEFYAYATYGFGTH